MTLLSMFPIGYPSWIAAVMSLLSTGYIDGGIQPHACTGFAQAAYWVTAEVRNKDYPLTDFLASLEEADMTDYKREQIEAATQWVYGQQITNPVVAKLTAMAMCLGEKRQIADPTNRARWEGPF
ncbi:MAG: hypothetical protein L0Y67_00550 [Gammaproteobacteria bacterium]|nr:hypothetical protein [Gammaproteobacteria bacterium]MCI0590094.1 hypothetical protein [Gammaproteobacteria bacterium]